MLRLGRQLDFDRLLNSAALVLTLFLRSSTAWAEQGTWDPRFGSVSDSGTAMIIHQGKAYCGNGRFWDGNQLSVWYTNGVGAGDFATDGTNLYAVGSIRVGDQSLTVGVWDGALWKSVGIGTTHSSFGLNRSLAAEWYRGQFFAAGNFSRMGWKPIEHVARYDGSDWLAVGDGVSHRISDESYIFALLVMGEKLYAGGIIDGLEPNPGVAQWDGTNWSYLGNSPVYSGVTYALSTDGVTLYSGGRFTTMNGVAATNIARWDGTHWHALGGGLNGDVVAIACVGNKVYAGGSFTKAGELFVPGIAVWDGSKWSGLGAGLTGTTNDPGRLPEVKHLLVYGSDLLISGYFSGAGDVPSKGFAIWHPDGRPELNMTRLENRIQLTWSSDQTSAVLEVSDSPSASNWLSLGSTTFGTNRFEATLNGTNRFFRLRQAP